VDFFLCGQGVAEGLLYSFPLGSGVCLRLSCLVNVSLQLTWVPQCLPFQRETNGVPVGISYSLLITR